VASVFRLADCCLSRLGGRGEGIAAVGVLNGAWAVARRWCSGGLKWWLLELGVLVLEAGRRGA
jgi:hypothetical protein